MRMNFLTEQALPLARARFSRCASVATNVAGGKRIRVVCNVAWDVAANAAAKKRRRVAFGGALNVVQAKRIRAFNVAPSVASLLPRLCASLMIPLLP
jgi:hypothetical protein